MGKILESHLLLDNDGHSDGDKWDWNPKNGSRGRLWDESGEASCLGGTYWNLGCTGLNMDSSDVL
jgi:hypothetical protein